MIALYFSKKIGSNVKAGMRRKGQDAVRAAHRRSLQ